MWKMFGGGGYVAKIGSISWFFFGDFQLFVFFIIGWGWGGGDPRMVRMTDF